MMRKSFRDPITGVLKAHGFVRTNEIGDLTQDEIDEFSLQPGKWRWNGSSWVAYSPPLTPTQIDINNARADSAIIALQNMTPSQAKAWVATNINSLADAKSLLGTMAAILCVLARRL